MGRHSYDPAAAPKEDPLFGPGLRMAYEQSRTAPPGALSTFRRLPGLVAITMRLGWRAGRGSLIAVIAGQLVTGVAAGASYLATRAMLTALLSLSTAAGHRLNHGAAQAVPWIAALVGISMARGLCTAVNARATGRLGPRISRLAHLTLLERAVGVELVTIEDPAYQNLLSAARRGADATARIVERAVGLSSGLVSLVATGSVLALLNPLLIPLMLVTLVPRAWGVARTAGARHASMKNWMELNRQLDLMAMLITHRESAEEIRVHRVGGFLLRHYGRLGWRSVAEQDWLARHDASTQLIAGAISGLAAVLSYGAIVALLLAGRMTLPVAATAAIALRTSAASLTGLVSQARQLYEDGLYIADWQEACRRAEDAAIPRGGYRLGGVPAVISASGLRFVYPGQHEAALDGVDVTIAPGEIVAFVGENGSGKSTLAKLLTGLYLPTAGEVCWNGVPTTDLDRESVFDRVALVSQDFVQWPFTAAANVSIGRPELRPDSRRLAEAARKTGAWEVIGKLSRGWQTLLAREFWGGTNLSGGQWQRVALARAWFRDAPVLLFDEPTSALDPRTEIEIFDQVIELAGAGRTVILITHRLASVARADHIYVMQAGRVIEQGTHAELMRQNGEYTAMYRIQAAQYEREDFHDIGPHRGPGQADRRTGGVQPGLAARTASPSR